MSKIRMRGLVAPFVPLFAIAVALGLTFGRGLIAFRTFTPTFWRTNAEVRFMSEADFISYGTFHRLHFLAPFFLGREFPACFSAIAIS